MSIPRFNTETLFSGKPNLIDLTRLTKAPDIVFEKMPDGQYWATDRASFDGDPESKWCITGRGVSKVAALHDLLEQLTDVSQEPERQYEPIRGISSGAEPTDYRPAPYRDPDSDL